MPAIQEINVSKNSLTLVDRKGKHTFDVSKIPVGILASQTSIQQTEDYINNVWLPSLKITDYQVQVHVFSVSPLFLTCYAADLKEVIPLDWWTDN